MRHEIKRVWQGIGHGTALGIRQGAPSEVATKQWYCLLRRVRTALVVLAGALAVLALAGTPAWALPADLFAGSFGSSGAGAGQFKEPVGVAVNDATELGAPAAGDIYVVDRGNNRVERFNPTGSYLGGFNGSGTFEAEGKKEQGGAAPTGRFSAPDEIAVDDSGKTMSEDPSVGDVYVADADHQVIDKFSPTGAYLGQLSVASVGPPFGENPILGLAVDGSGSLWVYEENDSMIYKFADDGSLMRSFTTGRGSTLTATAEHLPLFGVAIDSNEDVYVNCCQHSVLKLSATGEELAEFGGLGITALALDASTNDLYVDKANSIEKYGPFGEPYASPLQTFGAEAPEGLSESSGIAVDGASGAVYVTEAHTDKIEIFKPRSVSIEAASEVEKRIGGTAVATLNGSVNPESIAVTACHFEYGMSTSYGQTAECSELPGSGGVAVAVHATLSGLQQDAVYDYRLVTENGEGQVNASENGTFQTPPAVDGLQASAASDVEQTSATLNGSLLPGGTTITACRFEYGIGSSSEHSAACAQLPGSDTEPATVDVSVAGLQPNTAYRYRLSATNEYGTATSSERLLHTTLAPATVADRAAFVSEVSQFAVVLNGTINPSNDITGYRFVYGLTSAYGASIPVPEGFAPINDEDNAVSQRLTGLQAGTTYHFALVATNGVGTIVGPDETFTTTLVPVPLVSTGSVSGVTRGEALLSGTIDPQGWITTYHFEYGPTLAYGSSWPTVDVNLGAFTGQQSVAVELQNLEPDTTYHYRLVASNPGGTTYGPDGTFTTATYPASLVQEAPALTVLGVAFPSANEGASATKTVKHKAKAKRRPKARKQTPRKQAKRHARRRRKRG